MATKKLFLHWRTAPRSVYVLLRWLPYFYAHENEDYNSSQPNRYPTTSPRNKKVFPVRRKILYEYEKSSTDTPDKFVNAPLDKFVKGYQPGNTKKDRADKESRVRQAVTTAAQMGLMDSSNAHLTQVGEKVVRGTFEVDDLLKQFLKMYIVANKGEDGVFPFKTLVTLVNELGYLSRNEMTFLFGVLKDKDISTGLAAVKHFREQYLKLPNKNKDEDVRKILKETWNKFFSPIPDRELFSSIRKGYTDAFSRFLTYTGMFYLHGRGPAAKLRVRDLDKEKFKMLLDPNIFVYPPEQDGTRGSARNYPNWFGNVNTAKLPWESYDKLKRIVALQVADTYKRMENIPNPAITLETLNEWKNKINADELTVNDLKEIEIKIEHALLVVNKDEYIQVRSQTTENRKEILDRYDLISQDADESALWLEVNTWKAFVSLNGDNKKVKPNFVMNPDLTPKSFAPGVGDTPDMEIYFDDSAIIPEVSLMVGVQQWEHEGSSVIDHVYKKIQEHKNRRVLGLFISSSINIRTNWQFFLLNRESWVGAPIPVVPLPLNKFVDILRYMYKHNLGIMEFNNLLLAISEVTKKLQKYQEWSDSSDSIIKEWKNNKGNYKVA